MITIAGAGVAGLATALELVRRGRPVRIFEAGPGPGAWSVSRFAGGMLAPWCEAESAGPVVLQQGRQSIDWWAAVTPVTRRGTLVVAPGRDRALLTRFARRAEQHRALSATDLAVLEPELAGRFDTGLFFAAEAHLDPRRALVDLAAKVTDLGGVIHYDTKAPARVDLDCTGIAAGLPDLRPVRGEMAILHAPDITLNRTLRLLHPRMPLYVVPRGEGRYMIGASMVESSSDRPVTVRALMELLGAAFALHPGLAEASVLETGAGLRPAFPDNLPRLQRRGDTLCLNGLYRHGFLLAPAMAIAAADILTSERPDEDHPQRQSA